MRLNASSRRVLLVVIVLAALFVVGGPSSPQASHADPQCTINWTGAGSDGLWSTPGNWDGGHVPGATDFACIPSAFAGTVTLASGPNVVDGLSAQGSGDLSITGGSLELTDPGQPSTVVNLDLEGGALTVDSGATLSLVGQVIWGGGSLTGSGTTTIGPGASVDVTGTAGTPTLDDQAVVNDGTIDWTAQNWCIGGSAVVTNESEIDIEADGGSIGNCIGGADSPELSNDFGTIVRTSAATPAATASIGIPFQNNGTLDLESGILGITGDYAPTGDSSFQTEISGTAAGTGFGQLQVTGTETAMGFLSANDVSGFTPSPTDTFPIVTCGVACNGTFSLDSPTYVAQYHPQDVTLAPAPPAASVNPDSLDFGFDATGTTTTQPVSVSNGGGSPLTVTGVTVGGTDPSEFAVTMDLCTGASLAPGDECTFDVAFAPTSTGSASATVSITDNDPTSPQTVTVSGTGVTPGPPNAQVAPSTLDFTNQTPGTTSFPQQITVTDIGGSPLPISGVTLGGANPAEFAIEDDECSGTSVAIEQTCTVDVVFAPTAVGSPTATVTITDQTDKISVPVTLSGVANPGLVVHDLNHGSTATQLANSLVGNGVTISNVTYTGTPNAAGSFSGGANIIGFDSGIVLSSGSVETIGSDTCSKGIEGPNQCDSNTTENGSPGDDDLTKLAGDPTFDASILEFDFVPTFSTVQFQYVFGSDEYNEFVNSEFNDVFGFFVNGANCATVPGSGQPVSVNTINGGNPFGTSATNPSLYRNNSLSDPGPPTIDTEMDGLTVVLTCNANVNPGVTNHMKLAIADASDAALDSNVLVEGGSLISGTQIATNLSGGGQSGSAITVPAGTAVTDSATLSGANSTSAAGSVTYTVFSDSKCSTVFAGGGTKTVTKGVVPDSDPVSFSSGGTYFWQASYTGDSLNNPATSLCADETVTVNSPVTTTTTTTVPTTTTTVPGTTTTTTTVPGTTTTTTTVPGTSTTTTTVPGSTTTTTVPGSTTTTTVPGSTTTTTTTVPATTTTTTTVPPTTTTVPATTTTLPPTTTTTTTTLPPTATTTTRPVPPPTTIPRMVSPTTTAHTPTTTIPATTTTTTTTTTTVPPTTTSTLVPTTTTPPHVSPTPKGLAFASPSGVPGSDVVASGAGCAPGSAVQFLIEGQVVGGTVADARGAFEGAIQVPSISVGPHMVVSQCGGLSQQRTFMVVLATAINSTPNSVFAAVLAFFVLIGLLLMLIRPRVVRSPASRRRRNQ